MSVPSPSLRVTVVIPAHNESRHIGGVLAAIPSRVSDVIVIDDASTDDTADIVRRCPDPRVILVRHERNLGVGAAMVSGYRRALEQGAEVVVKVDGDGQMHPAQIPALLAPIVDGRADYTKGARFYEWDSLRAMPRWRFIGNLGLSFLTKAVSGYWNLMDPANGFTAIHHAVLERLPLSRLAADYFFETDMLIHLYRVQAVVVDVPMPASYGDEESGSAPCTSSPPSRAASGERSLVASSGVTSSRTSPPARCFSSSEARWRSAGQRSAPRSGS